MTHTPGPWRTKEIEELTNAGERRPASYIYANKGWANSGMAGQRTIAIVGHWKDRTNPEDDARLIAAAPELLEALEACYTRIFNYNAGMDDVREPSVVSDLNNEALDRAEALLRALR